jgi:hypothetical protein
MLNDWLHSCRGRLGEFLSHRLDANGNVFRHWNGGTSHRYGKDMRWKSVPYKERHFSYGDWEIAPSKNYMTIGRRGVQGWEIVPVDQDINGTPREGYTNMRFNSKPQAMRYIEGLYNKKGR